MSYDHDSTKQLRIYNNQVAQAIEVGKGEAQRPSLSSLLRIAQNPDRNTGEKADPATKITVEGDLKGGNSAHLLTHLAAPEKLAEFLSGLNDTEKSKVLNSTDAQGRTAAFHLGSDTCKRHPNDTLATLKVLADAGYDFNAKHEVVVNGEKKSMTPKEYAIANKWPEATVAQLDVVEHAVKFRMASNEQAPLSYAPKDAGMQQSSFLGIA